MMTEDLWALSLTGGRRFKKDEVERVGKHEKPE